MRRAMKSDRFFYLSGLFSFLLYCAIIFIIFAAINTKGPDRFVIKKDTQYDSIPIEALLAQSDIKMPEMPKQQEAPPPPAPLEEETQEQEATPSLKDAFSDIPNFEQKNAKKREEQKRLEQKRNQEKKLQEAKRQEERKREQQALAQQQEKIRDLQGSLQNMNKMLEKMDASIDIKTEEALPNQDRGLYDEWIAEIYKILYKNWNFSFFEKTTISVLVKISSDGDFSYSILKYSEYDEYNQKTRAMLDSLEGEYFPPYPKGGSMNIVVNFKSKEKDE